jgi:diphosphomevalonate decarboxylase
MIEIWYFCQKKIAMFLEKDFIAPYSHEIEKASFAWEAPSNIALVKYWGKIKDQIPANPSISFTLSSCKTITKINVERLATFSEQEKKFSFEFIFEGEPKPDFHPKINQFFERIEVYCPFLKAYHFVIASENTFPHSSGIASSASGMAALALNIMSLERALNPLISDDYFYSKASFLARLGSGSACRSIRGEVVIWGENHDFSNGSNLFGMPFTEIHPIFQKYQDTILLVDKGEKQVSSTVGHNLMHEHPYADERFKQAKQNLERMKTYLQSGNLEQFIALVENEALTLHAMMMTSNPYFILMKPNTLEIINAIWKFRSETKIPVCFTLDAGANVHVLYPENVKDKVFKFISENLVNYCQNKQYICDHIGSGSKMLIKQN